MVATTEPVDASIKSPGLANGAFEAIAAIQADLGQLPKALSRRQSVDKVRRSQREGLQSKWEQDETEHAKDPSTLTAVLGSYPFTLASQAFSPSAPSAAPRYSLRFVLLVALISFLFGSLLRSLLTPADFILYPREASGEIDMHVLQALDPQRRWRQARRLFEVRTPGKHDFILAAVRK
jgi:hypothetical protein